MCASCHSQQQTHILVTVLYFHIALNNNNLNFFHLERDGTIITTNYYNQLCGARFSPLLDETIARSNESKSLVICWQLIYGHLKHLSLLPSFTPFLCNIRFNIILLLMHRYQKFFLTLRVFTQNLACILNCFHAYHLFHPSLTSWFNHLSNMG